MQFTLGSISPGQKKLLTLSLIACYWTLARMSGTKAKCLLCEESHVGVTFSSSNFHDMTNSIIEVPGVGVQLPEWQVTLHSLITVCTGVGKWLHILPSEF